MTRSSLTFLGVGGATLGTIVCAVILLSPASSSGTEAASSGGDAGASAAQGLGPSVDRSADRDERRIRKLHEQLKITASEEALWAKVSDAMRSSDEKLDAISQRRHDHARTASALEDLKSYGEFAEAHAASIRLFYAAFEELYQAMPTSQQANADHVFRVAGHKMKKTT